MLLPMGVNETAMNLSADDWDDLDSLWPDQTPFDVVWYGVLLIVLYSLVFTACVVGKTVFVSFHIQAASSACDTDYCDRCLRSVVCLSVSLSVCLLVYQSVCLSHTCACQSS